MNFICCVNPFIIDQQVYSVDDNGKNAVVAALATIDKLPEIISALCADLPRAKITLTGNKQYNNIMAENIKTYALQYYNNNNIEIEVQ